MAKVSKPKGPVPSDTAGYATIGAACTFRERHKVQTDAAEAGLTVSMYLRLKLGLDNGGDK